MRRAVKCIDAGDRVLKAREGRLWSGTRLGAGLAGMLAACLGGQASSTPASAPEMLASEAMSPPPSAVQQAQVRAAYGKLPLAFEPNRGQTDPQVQFLSRGPGYTLFLTPSEAVLSLRGAADPPQARGDLSRTEKAPSSPSPAAVLRMKLLGANAQAALSGADLLPGQVNYLRGQDPAQWRTNIPTYAKVRYDEVYEGIDLVYYGNPQRLEYDFVVAPEADPGRIRLGFTGTSSVPRLEEQGDLVLPTALGEVRLQQPMVHQEVDGRRQEVAGRYVLHPHAPSPLPTAEGQHEGIQVGFEVAAYDRSRPLVIDPVLVYSTYLGGSNLDFGWSIAVDRKGRAYVTGFTNSTDFPTHNALRPTFGGGDFDVFVAKFSTHGSALVYSTYLGGSDSDEGTGIVVDREGRAYVTGETFSTDFPIQNALQPSCAGGSFLTCQDAFVTKLSTDGSAFVYSTYLGGSSGDVGNSIAVDREGRAYVTGQTGSIDFPTRNALQSTLAGSSDVYVAKLSAKGAGLVYSTYLGGSSGDIGLDIAVDREDRVYVTGVTQSTDFPTEDALQSTFGGFRDAFIAKLNARGTALIYSTYLGGSSNDEGLGIAVDRKGRAYVTGFTNSTDFPTHNTLQPPINAGSGDAYIAKLSAEGAELIYSTYLGGGNEDIGNDIAVDGAGQAYVTGYTDSTDFPAEDALQPTLSGYADAFVTKFNTHGTALVYSTYLGGSGGSQGYGIAVDRKGRAYVTGVTNSTDFPTQAALQPALRGGVDAFVTKIRDCPHKTSQERNVASDPMEEEGCR